MSLEGLQRYQIMESLGAGSQGHTYRAIDRVSGDEVAVKVLSLGKASDWKSFELFEREAKVLAGLDHPGIPRYRDYFASEDSGDYFLVMELVRGRSLAADMAKPGRFDEARLRQLMDGLLDILAYLHSRTPPVIHRDIKPANVIVGPKGRVHLVDFGGVRVAARVEGGSTMIGTFGYMAPEQLHGDAGPKVDLYALGATIVALASGRPADDLPHEGLAIDLDQLRLPAKLRPVLAELLQPDPRDRLGSVDAVRARLRGPAPSSGKGGKARSRSASSPRTQAPSGSNETALAIPSIVHELAQTPKPLSILVWLSALLGAGMVAILEFVALPIVYLILLAFAERKTKGGDEVDEDQAGITEVRDFRRMASRNRQYLAHVIAGTSPLRDSKPALPPGSDEG